MSHHRCRKHRTHHPAWFWALALLVLVKAAVPLLATVAAGARGVDLVEVCSIYGTRTVEVTAQADEKSAPPATGHGIADGHCALSSVLGPTAPSVHAESLAVVPKSEAARLHAPRAALDRADPVLRWLVGRLHAPPSRV